MDATIDVLDSFEGPQLLDSTSICPGQAPEGRHYVAHTVPVSNGRIEVELAGAGASSIAAVNGFQLVKVGVGVSYCTAEVNSTGAAATLAGLGRDEVLQNDLTLLSRNLPANSFALFLTSRIQGFQPGANGSSNGNLCLDGTIGRFVGPGAILSSGSAGEVSLRLDLMTLPQGSNTAAALAGETWSFQCWYRDPVGLGSNLSSGLEVTFR